MALITTRDLLQAALFDAGEKTDGTSDFHQAALRYINEAYFDICLGGGTFGPLNQEAWDWLMLSTTITFQSPVKGTATVTNGSATATISPAPSISLDGYHFKFGSWGDVFKIQSHTAGSSTITLDVAYTGDSSSGDYIAFKADYSLPSPMMRLFEPLRADAFYAGRVVQNIDLTEFHQRFPLSLINQNVPTHFAVLDDKTIRFNAIGIEGKQFRIDLRYLRMPDELVDSPTNEPLIPVRHRKVLANAGTYRILLEKNDDRFQRYFELARNGVAMMINENRQTRGRTSANFRPSYRQGRQINGVVSESGVIFRER